ncbi:MAG: hypothetical protein B0W54_18565 [Cellvibrio sp. 79]|nr:MAG: hypothetical protein B0W54_18565 [Cellvibrio sp. 79]
MGHREPSFKFPAFGGTFLGYDYGEFYGGLFFKAEDNTIYEILSENIVGIYRSGNELFVFTGLNHLLINEGSIYKIENISNTRPEAKKIENLSGRPYEIFPIEEKGISFKVKGECHEINFVAPNIVKPCAP